MTQASYGKLKSTFSKWLRKARLLSLRAFDDVERSFDLGHDLEGTRCIPRYVIDRKWRIVDAPKVRDQILRQSEVLAEHRLLGMWEVTTEVQKERALKLIDKMNVTNIKVRVVKP
ncbi:MAG TPA: hypothetical protein VGE65_08680 [Sphingobium sp.]